MGNVVRESVEGIGVSKLPESLGTQSLFTEVAIPEIVTLPEVKPDMEQLLSVMVDAKVVSLRIIDTPEGISNEGQILTGKKLSIELLLKQKVKYIADEPTQSVHAAHFEHVVNSLWVIVPKQIGCKKIEDLLRDGKLIVTPYIEDIYGEQMDKRTIFKNITVLVHVTSPCLVPAKADIKLLKSVNNNHVKVGDTVTYTVVVRNSGSVKATSVVLKDVLNSYVDFVPDSVTVDGSPTTEDPTTSPYISLGDINPGSSKVVTFNAEVNSLPPDDCKINNTSEVTYSYIDTSGISQSDSSTSNTVAISADDVKLGVVKTGPTTAASGSKIPYTIVIKNDGTVGLNNIVLKDVLTSTGTNATFDSGSLRINGAYSSGNPTDSNGVNLGALSIGGSITVSFTATAPTTTPPATITITNTATVSYDYILDQCVLSEHGTPVTDDTQTIVS